jgi:hypothetical protein
MQARDDELRQPTESPSDDHKTRGVSKLPPATAKQKAYIRFPSQQNRVAVPMLNGMSKAQAKSDVGRLKIEEKHAKFDAKRREERRRAWTTAHPSTATTLTVKPLRQYLQSEEMKT